MQILVQWLMKNQLMQSTLNTPPGGIELNDRLTIMTM